MKRTHLPLPIQLKYCHKQNQKQFVLGMSDFSHERAVTLIRALVYAVPNADGMNCEAASIAWFPISFSGVSFSRTK